MAVASDQPTSMLSRVERLDLMMSYLEEIKGVSSNMKAARDYSTASTTTTMSEGGNSSVNSSPKSSMERRCRPIDDVVMETRVKGSLIERVDQLESRLLKLEEDIGSERKRGCLAADENKKKQKNGLKSIVKSCVRGNLKTRE